MSGLVIVNLTRQNCKEILTLTNSCFPEEASRKWPEIAYRSSLGYAEAMRKNRENQWCKYWAAYDNGQLAGTVGLYVDKDNKSGQCWLGWFCVDPAFRRKGIGKQLLLFAIEEAHGKGYSELWLYTDPSSFAAQHLYEKMGFVIQEEFPDGIIYRMKKIGRT